MLSLFLSIVLLQEQPPESTEIPKGIRAHFMVEDFRRSQDTKKLQEQLDRAKKKKDKKAIKETQKSISDIASKTYKPTLPSNQFATGRIGHPESPLFKVVSVIDDQTALLMQANTIYMLKGSPTKGMSDGAQLKLTQCIEIGETENYTATSGAKKTVLTIKPFDATEIDKYRSRWAAEKAKK